jgi:hypothetical protein
MEKARTNKALAALGVLCLLITRLGVAPYQGNSIEIVEKIFMAGSLGDAREAGRGNRSRAQDLRNLKGKNQD